MLRQQTTQDFRFTQTANNLDLDPYSEAYKEQKAEEVLKNRIA